ncbi:MAG: hypothetical protein O7I93_06990, partial [Gemmatimonadetes bacterium]|nr:hypothetical protein [Gemmatimonadota bacterium]
AGPAAEDDLIRIGWAPVTTNPDDIDCDPQPSKIRDLEGYRLYRSDALADPPSVYLEPDALQEGTEEYEDINVVACRTYYYNITAVDKCDKESLPRPAVAEGAATTQHRPAPPTGLQADPVVPDMMNLQWDRVSVNTNGDPTQVDHYRIYRAELPAGLLPSIVASAITWDSSYVIEPNPHEVTDVTIPQFTDDTTGLPADPANSLYYRVSALNDCAAPDDEGALSAPNEGVTCDLEFSIVLAPAAGTTVTGVVDVSLNAVPVGDPESFTGFVVITDAVSGTVFTHGSGLSPLALPFTASWDTTGLPSGDYTMTATVIDSSGCSDTVSQTVSVLMPVACCIAPQSPVLGPTTGQLSKQRTALLFNLVNNCGQDLAVTALDAGWTNNIATHKMKKMCYGVPPDVQPENCTGIINVQSLSPVSLDLTPGLSFNADRDDLNPLIMGFKFDLPLATLDPPQGETINVSLFYEIDGAPSAAQCNILIHTDPLDIGTVEP